MMPRTIWTGSLSFGLVNVPIALMPAIRQYGRRMRELRASTGVPVRVQRVCSVEDVPVPDEEIVRGLQIDGEWVMLTDEELASAAPRRTDTIEIKRFIDLRDVEPAMYERPYWVVPTAGGGDGGRRAYRLLVEVMGAGGRAALGETVIHSREHPVIVRVREQRLLLSTLLFKDELRSIEDLDLPRSRPKKVAIDRAVAVIEELSTEFTPSRYTDRHEQRVDALIKRKSKGERIEHVPEPQAPQGTPDLIGALEESLAKIRSKAEPAPRASPTTKTSKGRPKAAPESPKATRRRAGRS